MKKYILYTESRDNLDGLASIYFDGFTLVDGTGYYKGSKEKSSQIILVTDDEIKIEALALTIKRVNKQETVLIEQQDIKQQYI